MLRSPETANHFTDNTAGARKVERTARAAVPRSAAVTIARVSRINATSIQRNHISSARQSITGAPATTRATGCAPSTRAPAATAEVTAATAATATSVAGSATTRSTDSAATRPGSSAGSIGRNKSAGSTLQRCARAWRAGRRTGRTTRRLRSAVAAILSAAVRAVSSCRAAARAAGSAGNRWICAAATAATGRKKNVAPANVYARVTATATARAVVRSICSTATGPTEHDRVSETRRRVNRHLDVTGTTSGATKEGSRFSATTTAAPAPPGFESRARAVGWDGARRAVGRRLFLIRTSARDVATADQNTRGRRGPKGRPLFRCVGGYKKISA